MLSCESPDDGQLVLGESLSLFLFLSHLHKETVDARILLTRSILPNYPSLLLVLQSANSKSPKFHPKTLPGRMKQRYNPKLLWVFHQDKF